MLGLVMAGGHKLDSRLPRHGVLGANWWVPKVCSDHLEDHLTDSFCNKPSSRLIQWGYHGLSHSWLNQLLSLRDPLPATFTSGNTLNLSRPNSLAMYLSIATSNMNGYEWGYHSHSSTWTFVVVWCLSSQHFSMGHHQYASPVIKEPQDHAQTEAGNQVAHDLELWLSVRAGAPGDGLEALRELSSRLGSPECERESVSHVALSC